MANLNITCMFRERFVVDRYLRSSCLVFDVDKNNSFSLMLPDPEEGHHRQDQVNIDINK